MIDEGTVLERNFTGSDRMKGRRNMKERRISQEIKEKEAGFATVGWMYD